MQTIISYYLSKVYRFCLLGHQILASLVRVVAQALSSAAEEAESPLEVILLSDSQVPGWTEEVYGPKNYIMLRSSSGTALQLNVWV